MSYFNSPHASMVAYGMILYYILRMQYYLRLPKEKTLRDLPSFRRISAPPRQKVTKTLGGGSYQMSLPQDPDQFTCDFFALPENPFCVLDSTGQAFRCTPEGFAANITDQKLRGYLEILDWDKVEWRAEIDKFIRKTRINVSVKMPNGQITGGPFLTREYAGKTYVVISDDGRNDIGIPIDVSKIGELDESVGTAVTRFYKDQLSLDNAHPIPKD